MTVTETSPLEPDAEPEDKTYAPGIGLINDAGILKLTSIVQPRADAGLPVLSIQDAVLLSWPLTDRVFQIESSADLVNWTPLEETPRLFDGYYRTPLPRDAAQK